MSLVDQAYEGMLHGQWGAGLPAVEKSCYTRPEGTHSRDSVWLAAFVAMLAPDSPNVTFASVIADQAVLEYEKRFHLVD